MNADIDQPLAHLAMAAPNARLDGLEDCVLAGIKARRQQTVAARVTLSFASVALLMGVAGAVLPAARASATATAPFGMPSALAPSSLLLSGGR